jgi:hypothetical protein
MEKWKQYHGGGEKKRKQEISGYGRLNLLIFDFCGSSKGEGGLRLFDFTLGFAETKFFIFLFWYSFLLA